MSLIQDQGKQRSVIAGYFQVFDDEIVSVTRSRRASYIGSHTALTMFNLDPLDFQIVALSASQAILAESSVLKLLGYIGEILKVLIVGGSGGIGSALIKHYLIHFPDTSIYATYRSKQPLLVHERIAWFKVDATSEHDIEVLSQQIPDVDIIINAIGILHSSSHQPEKTIQAIDEKFFIKNIQINTLSTIYLAKYFAIKLKKKSNTFFVTVSAKIGSIEDNKVGGWISYRCSKAALNMAIKTISIEWKYKSPNCCIFAFHPGTTDSPLSKPFQKKVPQNKLFTTEFVARSLVELLQKKTPDDSGKFFSYSDQQIPW